MANVVPQATAANGTLTFAAASGGGDTITGATVQRLTFYVTNGTGSSINVTFAGSNPCNYGSTHSVVVACAANVTTAIQILGGGALASLAGTVSSTGTIAVTYSSATTITVAAATT